MQDKTLIPPGRRPSAPDAVWDAVRRDYLAGVSAPECARRHGVGTTALHRRAAQQGWRRADQPWLPSNRLDAEDEGVALEAEIDGDLDRIDPGQLAFIAWRRMMRAVLRGDAAEALRWRRIRMAMDEDQDELDRQILQDDMIIARRADANAADAVDAADAADRTDGFDVFPEPSPG